MVDQVQLTEHPAMVTVTDIMEMDIVTEDHRQCMEHRKMEMVNQVLLMVHQMEDLVRLMELPATGTEMDIGMVMVIQTEMGTQMEMDTQTVMETEMGDQVQHMAHLDKTVIVMENQVLLMAHLVRTVTVSVVQALTMAPQVQLMGVLI